MKLHIGSGTVYLNGWMNMDMPGPKTFLARDRPDLVNKWSTTEDDYYGRHENVTIDTLRKGPIEQEYVCDVFGNFESIPVGYWECDQVLSRQAFEHLSISEAHRALDQIDGIMKPGGTLTLDVPDSEATLEEYRRTGDAFYKRHFLGPRRNDNGYHLPYTRERLKALVEEHGFIFEAEEENIHFFPAFCMRFRKPGPRAPRDYVELPPIPENWRMLDIGPGQFPHPRANFYLDKTLDNLKPLSDKGKGTIIGDLEKGLLNVESKSFDYVWCSHVLEHMEDPQRCAHTLSRIAKRGTLVVPWVVKEELFLHEEREHLWSVQRHPERGGPPIFIRKNRLDVDKVADSEMQSVMCRFLRTGPNRIPEQRYARKYFYQHEKDLDVVVHWENELRVQVIG